MTVSDLKKLINELPNGMSQSEFEKLPVFISNGDSFDHADVQKSGYVIGQDGFDAKGMPVDDVPFFGILTKES